ncbi:TlpA family protein disulfide reductase [bacterium]|nr:TlpA family protein disulfide reductase [bacterium]MCI0601593.1 TlpA family protein disulfide reductase [bacterium]
MLDVNQTAPDFTLKMFGNGEMSFYASAGPLNSVLIFYKFSCGTSRFAFPFLQKIYDAYAHSVYFTAIAQDNPGQTAKFREELGITVPILLDEAPYPASRAYGLHTVPSIFLVDPEHKIRFSSYGFVKQDILNLADILSEKSGADQIDVFESAEVPEMKPG